MHTSPRYKARWGLLLQISTLVWFCCLGAASYWGYTQLDAAHRYLIPQLAGGFTLMCFLLSVRAYRIRGTCVEICRPLWTTRVDVHSLHKIRIDASAMQGCLPLLGNPGLFAYTGLYHSERHKHIRVFVTDPRTIVRVSLKDHRTYFFSPEDPEGFLKHLRMATRPGP